MSVHTLVNKDRLIKEMRLAGVSSLAEGNAFLQSWLEPFNEKFAVAAGSGEDGHRPFPAGGTLQSRSGPRRHCAPIMSGQ